MIHAILVAVALYAYVALGRRYGIAPFKGSVCAAGSPMEAADASPGGKVANRTDAMLWYEAGNALQIAHVQGEWDRRIGLIAAEGRLFMVPGRSGCTTWDHLDIWRPFADGLSTRAHCLRIVHNHWRHDMDNDAIALEFASHGDLATFLSRVPEAGPVPYDMAGHLGPAGAAQLKELLARNRLRTELEAA